VEAAIGPVNYVTRRSRRAQPVAVHVDKLKPYWGEVPRSWLKEDNESETHTSDSVPIRERRPTGSA